MSASARETVREYYEALRRGEPLDPYFTASPATVKVGVFSRHVGSERVGEELREQGRTTTDWTVESHDLRVGERETHAWFGDLVDLSWRDTVAGRRHGFETRWSGTLEPRTDDDVDPEWCFVAMHVSVAHPWDGDAGTDARGS